MVLLEVRKGDGTLVGRCDARCYDAKHEHCDCICHGANHGKGLNQALENKQQIFMDLHKEYPNEIVTNFFKQTGFIYITTEVKDE